MCPTIVLAHCQHLLQGGGNTAVFLSERDEAGSLGRPRCLAFTGQSTIEERDVQRESPRVLQSYPTSLQLSTDQHMKNLPKVQERVIQKYQRDQSQELSGTQSWKQFLFPPTKVENLIIYRQMERTLRSCLPLQWGKNFLLDPTA